MPLLQDVHGQSFDFQPGGSLPFYALIDLEEFNDVDTAQGAVAYVGTFRSLWVKTLKSPPPVSDGVTVVPTLSGDGGWYRSVESPSWTDERRVASASAGWFDANWYVDTSSGDDENDGGASSPLATVAEFGRRVRTVLRQTMYNVFVTGDVAREDVLDMTGLRVLGDVPAGLATTMQGRPVINIIGTKSLNRSGTVAAAQQTNFTTEVQAEFTSNNAAEVFSHGEQVVFPSVSATGFVLKDLTAGQCRLSTLFTSAQDLTAGYNNSQPTATGTVPIAGAAYEVYTMPLHEGRITISGDVMVYLWYWNFPGSPISPAVDDVGRHTPVGLWAWGYRECHFPGGCARYFQQRLATNSLFITCCTVGDLTAANNLVGPGAYTTTMIYCSAMIGVDIYPQIMPNYYIANCSFQGGNGKGRIRLGETYPNQLVELGGLITFWDWGATSAIYINKGSVVSVIGAASIFGSGGNEGVSVQTGGKLMVSASATPKLKGTTYDINFGGLTGNAASATAPIPTPTTGAVTTWSASAALNQSAGAGWTAWATTFNKYVFDYRTGSSIFAV